MALPRRCLTPMGLNPDMGLGALSRTSGGVVPDYGTEEFDEAGGSVTPPLVSLPFTALPPNQGVCRCPTWCRLAR